MNSKTKARIIGYYFITLLVLLGLSINCKQATDARTFDPQFTTMDSISAWITASDDTSKSIETRTSSLQKAYESVALEPSDSIKLKYLSKIQWKFSVLNDSTWFRKTNKETYELARKIEDSTRMAGSQWDLGFFLRKIAVSDSAYFNLLQAKKLYAAMDNNLNVGKLEYDMALLQSDTKNYASAEVGVIKAIELLKPFEENVMLYKCYNLLGIIAKDVGDNERSLEYYGVAKQYLEKSALKNLLDTQLANNLGVAYQENGEHLKAVAIFENILSSDSLFTKRPGRYATVLRNLAQSQHRLNPNGRQSESMFLRSLEIEQSLGYEFGMAGGFYQLSEYYLEKKDTAKALSNVLKAKSYAESSNNNERLLESLALLNQLDPRNASIYGQRYMNLNDSLQQAERKLRDKFARIRFETNEVVAENEALAREKQLWTGIAVSLVMLGLAGYTIISQRIKNKNLKFRQEQQASNQEIFNLMLAQGEKVEEGKKMEQKRVSEELHDGVLGKMLGARMMLLGLNKKTDTEAIAERAKAISILQDVEGEVRSISHELSHAAYQKIHNFILSIKDLTKTIQSASKINIGFKFTDELDWDALSGEIKINLYRMVQESLQNSVKHAACKNISMNFYADEAFLTVDIVDDGKGFVQKKRKKGIGMRNMASRIAKVNGTWDIKSKVGKGTTVTFVIPLVSNDSENAPSISPREHKLQAT